MKRQHPSQASRRSGVILLVVLGALTFFSILVATYLVFANDSRDASVALSRQSARAPDVNWMMNEALMTLVRGTGDSNNPFFGEDLLSDYYGHDFTDMRVRFLPDPPAGGTTVRHPKFFANGIVRFPISGDGTNRETGLPGLDDVYAGRLITFTEGPLRNQTYRVIRSIFRPVPLPPPAPPGSVSPTLSYDDVYIDIQQSVFGNTAPAENPGLYSQFYSDPDATAAGSYAFHMNGSPRNSAGIGFDTATNNIDQMTGSPSANNYRLPSNPGQPLSGTNPPVGLDLPVALQPNHIGRIVDKSVLTGDYDEDYDAADFNNWWLSHRRADTAGSVIPSFHRPAVLNYILNETDWSGAATQADVQNLIASFARGTFRPFPIGQGQMGGTGAATFNPAINDRFTGGSNEYALRIPLRYYDSTGAVNTALLNQLARALIDGTYDVDNDADGFADSIWIDLGLPLFTSREGKLLRPLVAPMIEDMSARLNLNAHSNSQLAAGPTPFISGLSSPQAFWAGTTGIAGTAPNNRFVFRGLGWGPAEIGLPLPVTDSAGNNLTPAQINMLRNDLFVWLNERYRFGEQQLAAIDQPGRALRDPLDLLRFGARPPFQRTVFGYARSTDPFGRGGAAMGRGGDIITALSGGGISNGPAPTPVVNEAVNNPYETDPSGQLGGDRAALLADLEVLLRNNDFDSELLPQPLRERLQRLINFRAEYSRSFTTLSISDDSPASVSDDASTPYLTMLELIDDVLVASGGASGSYTQVQWNQFIAPELRLGRKLDINRPFGNGVDDGNGIDDNGNGFIDEPAERGGGDPLLNGVVDEPREVTRRVDGMDNDGDTLVDEGDELTGEINAFASFNPAPGPIPSVGTIPAAYNNQRPNYTFDEQLDAAPGAIPVSGRQLLARHLYILMMALSRNLDSPASQVDFISISGDPPLAGSGFDPDLYKARRLAQWAVNVVDYRDPDSINTRFVYDPTPFDSGGWSPPADTGGPQLPNGLHAPGGTQAPDDNVVWGVEAPQLVFSESMAYHDVRLRDIDRDTDQGTDKMDATNPDDDSDQVRMPQGSLFLELFCPHPVISGDQENQPGAPQELYTTVPGTGASELNLNRSAPGGAPVWRIAISQRHDAGSPEAPLDPDRVDDEKPDTYSFQPEYPDEIETPPPAAGTTLQYDRFILFRDFANTDTMPDAAFNALDNMLTAIPNIDMTAAQVFYAPSLDGDAVTNNDRSLQPGQFLMLAPRFETRFGSKEFATMVPGLPSDQRLNLVNGEGLVQANHSDIRLTPTLANTTTDPFTPALPMLIAAPRPTGWPVPAAANPNLANNVVGVSVSEPLPRGGSYYPQPPLRYNGTQDVDGDTNEDYLLTDAYIDFSDPATNAIDTPMDVALGRIPANTPGMNEPFLGTISNYCSAFLQRLADPTRPYHPTLNPYRTVDWMPIDLSVFSGEDRPTNISSDSGYTRRTRQRNGFVVPPPDPVSGAAQPAVSANALFSYETDFDDGEARLLDTVLPEFFQFQQMAGEPATVAHINSSFSFLNTDTTPLPVPFRGINQTFQGFAPSIGMSGAANVVGNDRNLPQVPYAIHPWLNRPFASHFELMMVPACSQGRLFEEFSFNITRESPVYPLRTANGIDEPGIFNAPFRHLLNFFHSNVVPTTPPTPNGAEFARLFDYVHTLPRFRGEVELINPTRLLPVPPNPPTTQFEAAMADIRQLMSPPFNLKYDNQRQGRINVNTVAEFPVWAGLMQGHLNLDEVRKADGDLTGDINGDPTGDEVQLSFDRFVESRRGYVSSPAAPSYVTAAMPYNYDPANLDPRFPTEFAGVFRSGTSTPKAIPLRVPADTNSIRRRPVNGTLLRGAGNLDVSDPTAGTPVETPMFVRAGSAATNPLVPPQAPNTLALPQPQHDRYRNPFMRYQTLMRMPNLAADNSQVYVIRLTLGFFEVDANTLSLKDEYNADIGQNERYQATFVIDRSIPVGFDPGEDLNARDIVIFESYAQ